MGEPATLRSVRDAVAAAAGRLEAAGCDTPRLDAELLGAAALGTRRERLHLDASGPLDPESEARLDELVRRRSAREPVAYILGRRAFRRIELAVDRRVLIPRPETELLVEIALELPPGALVHDAGTGSGAIALALADERPDLIATASDSSADAIEVARANAARLGLSVELSVARGFPPQAASADLVVANLPYVAEREWRGLAPEITGFEPRAALVSGPDGLDAIRELVAGAPSGSRLALEHAPGQAAAVRGLLVDATTRCDLAGLERATVGHAP
jgi:release factor glutamine methyltransferase